VINLKIENIDFKFDIKAMGIVFYVPILIVFLQLVYIYTLSQTFIEPKIVLPMFEFILVPFASWWILYLFNDYYERGGGELLFSYPVTTSQHGFFRITFMFFLYTILAMILFLFISILGDFPIKYISLQFIPQFYFFCGLTFLFMTLFKNVSIVLTIIAFYVSTEFLTQGNLIPWYHVFFFNVEVLDFYTLINKSLLNLVLGFLFIYVGGLYLRPGRS